MKKEENKDKGSGCLQDRGLEWNPEYEFKEVPLLTVNQKGSIMNSLKSDLFTIMRTLIKIPAIVVFIRKLVLEDLQAACTELSSLKKPSSLHEIHMTSQICGRVAFPCCCWFKVARSCADASNKSGCTTPPMSSVTM